jgi:hypothetical protein
MWPAVALLGCLTLPLLAQPGGTRNFNERDVDTKKPSPEDKPGIYTLDFRFKDPRVIPVEIPGRGKRMVWYLWYQVINNTLEPRLFNPEFVWVCHDDEREPGRKDQVLFAAQEAAIRLEDPNRLLDIKNSVTISQAPLPVNKEFDDQGRRIAFPKLTTGVAIWDNVPPASTSFSIYVYGLSDGIARVDTGPGQPPTIRRKTLQLRFKRLGDDKNHNSNQIRYLGFEWVYATAELPPPLDDKDKADLQKRANDNGGGKKDEKEPAAPGQASRPPLK